jgi:hypothetical protein
VENQQKEENFHFLESINHTEAESEQVGAEVSFLVATTKNKHIVSPFHSRVAVYLAW